MREVKIAGYGQVVFWVFMERVKVNKDAKKKKKRGRYPAILTKQA